MVQSLKSKAEFDAAINSGSVVLVDFYADWCGPCRLISPEFERLAKEHAGSANVEFYKVDIDAVEDVAEALGIRSIPTFHAFKDGNEIGKAVGADKKALGVLVQNGVSLA